MKDSLDGRQPVVPPVQRVDQEKFRDFREEVGSSDFVLGTVVGFSEGGSIVVDIRGIGVRVCQRFTQATVGERDRVLVSLSGTQPAVVGRRDPLPEFTDPGGGGGVLEPLFPPPPPAGTRLWDGIGRPYMWFLPAFPSWPAWRSDWWNGAWLRDTGNVFGLGAGAVVASKHIAQTGEVFDYLLQRWINAHWSTNQIFVYNPTTGDELTLPAYRLGKLRWFGGRLWNGNNHVIDMTTGENVPASTNTYVHNADRQLILHAGRLWGRSGQVLLMMEAGSTEWSLIPLPAYPDSTWQGRPVIDAQARLLDVDGDESYLRVAFNYRITYSVAGNNVTATSNTQYARIVVNTGAVTFTSTRNYTVTPASKYVGHKRDLVEAVGIYNSDNMAASIAWFFPDEPGPVSALRLASTPSGTEGAAHGWSVRWMRDELPEALQAPVSGVAGVANNTSVYGLMSFVDLLPHPDRGFLLVGYWNAEILEQDSNGQPTRKYRSGSAFVAHANFFFGVSDPGPSNTGPYIDVVQKELTVLWSVALEELGDVDLRLDETSPIVPWIENVRAWGADFDEANPRKLRWNVSVHAHFQPEIPTTLAELVLPEPGT